MVREAPGGGRVATQLGSLPILLSGSYRISSTIDLRAGGQGLTLCGAPATLSWQRVEGRTADAMLSIHDRSDVTIERVAFEGNGAVAFGAVVSSHLNPVVNIRFRECSFRSTTRALVRIGPDIPASASTAGARPIPSTRGDQLMWNIELLGCDFAGAGEDAILLRATRASGVHFGGCRFHGQANAMIAAFGGRFTLTSCMFANSRTTGCDVLLVHPFNEDGSDGLRSAPPSFTAIHCDSTSWTFLVTRTATAAQGPAFLSSAPTTVLVNVEHIAPLSYRRLSDAAAQASGQESLLWNPGFGNLILLGCSLTGMTDASAASASSIFNIASGFDRLNLPAGLGIRNAQFLSLAEYIEAANRRTQEARDDELAREAGMFPTGSIDTGSRSTVGDSGSSNAVARGAALPASEVSETCCGCTSIPPRAARAATRREGNESPSRTI